MRDTSEVGPPMVTRAYEPQWPVRKKGLKGRGGGLRSSHTGVHTHMCTQLEPPYGRGALARPRGEAGDPPPDCISKLATKPHLAPAASKAAGFPACGLTLTLTTRKRVA